MPAGGLLTAGLISGGTSIIGGLFGKNAAKSAAKTQSQAAQQVAGMATAAGDKAASGVTAAGTAAATGVTDAAQTGAGIVRDAAGNAINTVSQGTADANSTLANVFGGELANLSPYLGVGAQGASGLSSAMAPGGSLANTFSFDPTQVANNPDYQFANQQGQQAIMRAAAAQGKTMSGDTMKSLMQFGSGTAAQYMNQYYQQAANTYQTNRNNTLQTLMSAIGVGQTGTNQLQSAAGQYGSQVAGNTLQSAMYGANTMQGTGQYLSNLGVGAAQYAGTTGLQAATTAGGFGMNAAQIAGQAITGGANAQAAGTVGAANAINQGLGGVANAASLYSLGKIMMPQTASAASTPGMGLNTSISTGVPLGSIPAGGYG